MITLNPKNNVTEDTQNLATALAKTGPTGRIYLAPGTFLIDGTKIVFPNIPNCGWLSLELDGTINLVNGPLQPKLNTAILGRSGNPQGLAGAFVYDRYASIQVMKGYGDFPCIDMAGAQAVVLRGLNLQVDGGSAPLHIHDNAGAGSVWNRVEKCVIGCTNPSYPAILIDSSSPQVSAGYGLWLTEVSISAGTSSYAIKATNFQGTLVMRDCYFGSNGIYVENKGIPQIGRLEFDSILTEAFVDGAALLTTAGTWFVNVAMKQVLISDNEGAAYLISSPTSGSPPKYTVQGLRLEQCYGHSAIIDPKAPLGVAGITGFDIYGDPININLASSYAS